MMLAATKTAVMLFPAFLYMFHSIKLWYTIYILYIHSIYHWKRKKKAFFPCASRGRDGAIGVSYGWTLDKLHYCIL